MRIMLSPQAPARPLLASRVGDVITINGVEFDLSFIGEGDSLPAEAVGSEWFAPGTSIERVEGELHLTLILPHGAHAPTSMTHPTPITMDGDGVIPIPLPEVAHDN